MYQNHPTWRRFMNKYLYPKEAFNFQTFLQNFCRLLWSVMAWLLLAIGSCIHKISIAYRYSCPAGVVAWPPRYIFLHLLLSVNTKSFFILPFLQECNLRALFVSVHSKALFQTHCWPLASLRMIDVWTVGLNGKRLVANWVNWFGPSFGFFLHFVSSRQWRFCTY